MKYLPKLMLNKEKFYVWSLNTEYMLLLLQLTARIMILDKSKFLMSS